MPFSPLAMPYTTPIISWDDRRNGESYTIRIQGNRRDGTPFDVTFDWSEDIELFDELPIFPFLGFRLAEWLNNNSDANAGVWFARWIFEGGDTRQYDPRLRLYLFPVDSGNFTSCEVSAPFELLTTNNYQTARNWLGASQASQTIGTIGVGVLVGCDLPFAPMGVWNPGVLAWDDERHNERSVGMSLNSYTGSKVVTKWGDSVSRTINMSTVPAIQMFPHRRVNPAWEFDPVRRENPNNLYDNFTNSLSDDRTYWIFNRVGNPIAPGGGVYDEQFQWRTAKHVGEDIITDDSGAWSFRTGSQRWVNVSIEFNEFSGPAASDEGY